MNINEIESKLLDRGKSITASRREVIKMLIHVNRPVTADELYHHIHAAGSRVGRMTVFRTLNLLAEISVLRPVYHGSGAAHFVLLDGGKHHQLVCNQCTKTVEITDCLLTNELSRQLEKRHDFQIEGHLLELYGFCSDCQ